jgi:hypothetical protein
MSPRRKSEAPAAQDAPQAAPETVQVKALVDLSINGEDVHAGDTTKVPAGEVRTLVRRGLVEVSS